MKIIIFVLIVLCLFALLNTIYRNKKHKKVEKHTQIIVAKMETPVTKLFFSGTLQPITTIPVVSPIDGRVEKIEFEYGSSVTKGKRLLTLNSTQLAEQFQQAVSDFLQKKETYTNGIESFQGSTALYKAGASSRETYIQDKNTYDNNVLSFFQSRYKLEDVLKKVNIPPKDIENLRLGNTEAVDRVLRQSFDNIEILAPGSGVILFPTPDTTGGGEEKSSGKMRVGADIKSGQLLLSIGDLTGLATQVQVSEISITRLKAGIPAFVTGDAFPGITLKGVVTNVSTQANPEQGSGSNALSMFNVQVKIPKVSPEASKVIRVGMTAKIEIDIKEQPQIIVPIKAVSREDDHTWVTVQDSRGQPKKVDVITGNTSPTGVAIAKGLKEGDKVIVND